MGRHGNLDVQRAFEEFQDEENPTKASSHKLKCNKVRCTHCGFVRAKNTTRQVEHLQECQAYLNSAEYLEAMNSSTPTQQANTNGGVHGAGMMQASPHQPTPPSVPGSNGQKNFLMGQRPNPNLQVNRRGPNKRTRDGNFKPSNNNNNNNIGINGGRPPAPMAPMAPPPPMAHAPGPAPGPAPAGVVAAPSLTNYLLSRDPNAFRTATQQTFLSHAGCGTLSQGALAQWLAQDSHILRGYIAFVGRLIGKIRLPDMQSTTAHFNTLFRAMDLLISALNNVRREMAFFEVTATKYNLQLLRQEPSPVTKGYLDLFVASSTANVSLLEGMVVLWATELCYRTSWNYAASFSASLSQPILPFTSSATDSHNAALHQSLIPNWTSPAFAKFVDACRAVVDELANAQTSGNGREEMARCEGAWKQVLWLWQRSWPEVDGLGEEEDEAIATNRFGNAGNAGRLSTGGNTVAGANATVGGAAADRDASADDDDVVEIGRRGSGMDDAASYVSPYGGTGLQAVEAANHA